MTDTNPDVDGDRHVRPFADWLREQSAGATHAELGEGLHDLIARVIDTGKPGTLQLTVKVEPLKKSERGVLLVTDEIKLKLPEHDRDGSMFYTTREGNLSRTDPRQLTFESLREVPPPAVVDVDTNTGEITHTQEA